MESHYTIKVRHIQLCCWFKYNVAACNYDPRSIICYLSCFKQNFLTRINTFQSIVTQVTAFSHVTDHCGTVYLPAWTHYPAESFSWNSAALSKAACTPESFHSFFMTSLSSCGIVPSSMESAKFCSFCPSSCGVINTHQRAVGVVTLTDLLSLKIARCGLSM